MEIGSDVAPQQALGLRERKKLRTRETIARVALELFTEQGFHETTIREIADRAEVAPRTVSMYFPVKEELVFADHGALFDELEQRLHERPLGETTADALRAWITAVLADDRMELDKTRCRRQVVESDHALRTYERGLTERAEQLIAGAVAVDLGLPADDLVPRMVGAATMAALDALGHDAGDGTIPPAEYRRRGLELVDQAMTFIGAGIRGLQDAA
ncbi:TetR/AcrR family transcriptional regulator [Capillimicrobium parvum]|uniref:Mycofactocin biosynthesis transcriptional regulator MftR n=1 Tax=Capillimicrobium parvum TaxID=2884022 RepID=A0A9E6Y1Y0_9ACTN|nr:TetR/AcrR family transcriptional regulator [Capillimicrobium parvum]UGS38584.1 Putative mycofactocin biosynthesis transcriptional regulator MftR [Capillimicrobium parvum]